MFFGKANGPKPGNLSKFRNPLVSLPSETGGSSETVVIRLSTKLLRRWGGRGGVQVVVSQGSTGNQS